MAAVLDDKLTVDDHVLDPVGVAARLVIRGVAADPGWIEHRDVGDRAVAQKATIAEAQACGGRARHLANRLREPDHGLVAHELAEDPGEGTVGPRARLVA